MNIAQNQIKCQEEKKLRLRKAFNKANNPRIFSIRNAVQQLFTVDKSTKQKMADIILQLGMRRRLLKVGNCCRIRFEKYIEKNKERSRVIAFYNFCSLFPEITL